jgi:anti-sigma factor RsiW
LDLEELLAEVNGEAVSHRAREHRATCERCHAEALRWDTVVGGVRGLMGAVPEVARPSPPRPGRVAALAARKPRTLLAAGAAAALLLIGGASYGLTSALTRPGPASGNGTAATLTGSRAVPISRRPPGPLRG